MPHTAIDSPARYLVAAQCGRALACSASRAGSSTYVIDCFGDTDTRAASLGVTAIPAWTAGGGLLAAADAADPGGAMTVVYASGFERCPTELARLTAHRPLCGNPVQVLEDLRDPMAFASKLATLRIPHPPTRLDPPRDGAGWLVKQAGGCGGVHVRAHWPQISGTGRAADEYYQARVAGRTLSVTFLAGGGNAQVVGYAWQWHAVDDAKESFTHGGAVTLDARALPGHVIRELRLATASLSESYGLCGLNSLDVAVDSDARWWLLELNPRPGFAFELHEARLDPAVSLFDRHRLAVDGVLDSLPGTDRTPHAAHAIVYAPLQVRMATDPEDWPDWTSDRPPPGRNIAGGEPVCTVHAHGETSASARDAVQRRHESVLAVIRACPEAVVMPKACNECVSPKACNECVSPMACSDSASSNASNESASPKACEQRSNTNTNTNTNNSSIARGRYGAPVH